MIREVPIVILIELRDSPLWLFYMVNIYMSMKMTNVLSFDL